ncbi:hypothetical protein MPER_03530, partial [Moniliophthora perniciosa FA553]
MKLTKVVSNSVVEFNSANLGTRQNLVWQAAFFSLWSGFFVMIMIMMFSLCFATISIIKPVVALEMKRNAEFRQKIEERRAAVQQRRAKRAAEDLANGKQPKSRARIVGEIMGHIILSVIMTVNCAVFNRMEVSAVCVVIELAFIALWRIPVAIYKARKERRAREIAAQGSPAVQTIEVHASHGAADEKLLIDFADG